MMFRRRILISLSLLSYCVALDDSRSARILKQDFDNIGTGIYKYSFETSDGTSKDEQGEVHHPNTEDEFIKVTGSYKYTGPDGVVYLVKYTADDQGFHPEGDHIKVPPFVPWVHGHHEGRKPNNDGESQESKTPSGTYTPSKHSGQYQPESYENIGKAPYQDPKIDFRSSDTTPNRYQPYQYDKPSSPSQLLQETYQTTPTHQYESPVSTANTPSDNFTPFVSTLKSSGEYRPVNFPVKDNHINLPEPSESTPKTSYEQDGDDDFPSSPKYKPFPSGFTEGPSTPSPDQPSRYVDLPKSTYGDSQTPYSSGQSTFTPDKFEDLPKSHSSEQPDQYLDTPKQHYEDSQIPSESGEGSPSPYQPDDLPKIPGQYTPDAFSSTTSSPDSVSKLIPPTPEGYGPFKPPVSFVENDKLYIPPPSSTVAPYKLDGLDSS